MIYFTDQFEKTLKERWNLLAIGDYGQKYTKYGKMAENIAVMHEMWKEAGLTLGDKIAINAKSSSAWAQLFFAAITGGYISVQVLLVLVIETGPVQCRVDLQTADDQEDRLPVGEDRKIAIRFFAHQTGEDRRRDKDHRPGEEVGDRIPEAGLKQ